jgi:hypothetical protein
LWNGSGQIIVPIRISLVSRAIAASMTAADVIRRARLFWCSIR